MKKNTVILIFSIVFLVSIALRVLLLDYPSQDPDPFFDYLVARNAALYGEYPLILETQINFHSPAYVYFLSNILHLYDSFMFLSLVNMYFQVVSVAQVFILASILFNVETGLIAMALFSFSNTVLHQSLYSYPPYLAQPLFLLSAIYLALAHAHKLKSLTYLAIILYILAGSIYPSSYAFFPIFIFCLWRILKNMGRATITHCIMIGLITFLLCNLPVCINILFHHDNPILFSRLELNPSTYIDRVKDNMIFLLKNL